MNAPLLRRVLALSLALLVPACGESGGDVSAPEQPGPADDSPELEDTGTFNGASADLGDGRVYTWAELEDGVPIRLGVTMTAEAVRTLGGMQHLSLALPPEAQAATMYDHVLFDWNPQGHPPMTIYDRPHFDFHFYTISATKRAAIQAESQARAVAQNYLPEDYALVEEGVVPAMGAHWADTTSAEFDGDFDRTFIYVSHEGRIVAIEPMITRDHIEATSEELLPIKQPADYQRTGHYPTQYRIRFDSVAAEYSVFLESFVSRSGG